MYVCTYLYAVMYEKHVVKITTLQHTHKNIVVVKKLLQNVLLYTVVFINVLYNYFLKNEDSCYQRNTY